jgi:hypothetical protein
MQSNHLSGSPSHAASSRDFKSFGQFGGVALRGICAISCVSAPGLNFRDITELQRFLNTASG